jgi:NADH:ubiquinone oxidoreductase subunit 6 (subunit J)
MPGDELFILSALGVATIVMAVVAVLHKNLIRAIAAYAIASVCLSSIFFVLASPYAGALELTVGAGLVAVLFLVALILSGGEEVELPV